ncbi:trypsin-like serine protease [Paenibacillus sp. LMG 31456]|uniref:Trypsin-like serine protease n=1 Tax=Paenibacillus foliorum TaxID=2654974 RepID=A0A972K4V8_9BACL|nr:serine protease [Paenibacillus foliorum]NOU97358.1 trypsin-like serine protease [Paenibacillus foliorum]
MRRKVLQAVNFAKYLRIIFSLLVMLFFTWSEDTNANFQSEEQQSILTAQKLLQATVKIEPNSVSSGSGFFVASDLILTNYHVVKNNNSVISFRTYKELTCSAKLVRQEEYSDLALFRTPCSNDNYLPLQELAYVGQSVIVAGNPTGFDFSISKGIVSAFRPERIQFDAKINFGSSGGVVSNLYGEVIGVTTEKSLQEANINFAITAQRVNKFLQRAKE